MSLAMPLYLLGLAALALPWLLHRFGRQRAEQMDFASDRFLEAVPPPVSERHDVRYRVLFALRCLAVLALCLLFARPWLPLGEPRGAPRTLHTVVLDTSLSMRADARFERAVDALSERLAALPADDRVRLYTFGNRLQPIGEQAGSALEASEALGSLTAGHARGDFGELMRGLDAVTSRSDLPVQAIVATDLQDSALPVRRNDLFAPGLQGLELIDVGGEQPLPNVRVDATASTADQATARVQVEISAAATDTASSGTLVIEHDAAILHSERVSLSASRPWQRTFDALNLPPSPTDNLRVRFQGETGDALPDDDEQHVALRRVRPFVVSLAGIGATLGDRPRLFLGTALQGDGATDVRRASGGAQRLPADTDLAVVVVEPDDEAAMAGVREEVRRGTDLLVIPTPTTLQPGAVEAVESDRAIAPGRGEVAASSEQGVPVGDLAPDHPLGAAAIDWFGVRRYAPSRFVPEADDRVLVSTEDGVPLLLERRISGGGRLLLLDDPLDGEASNLPFEPAFVELLDAMRRWADSDGALPERIDSGTALAIPEGAQVFDSQGDALLTLAEQAGAERPVLEEPGLYRVLDPRGERLVEVVTAAAESRLVAMESSVRDRWQTRHDPDNVERSGTADPDVDADGDAARAAGGSSSPGVERADQRWLLAWLLPLLVVIVIGESLLGNRRLNVRRDGS